ncbi:hypothetical protein [uncultured Aquimarina sp.]|uniref:hypothetical protein n=1 Tax=uncultured Aquimarina sp. TaxID=575652 RepID=UPI002603E932|nr:hypothetical protein [uncultured Aquimarina sp.]
MKYFTIVLLVANFWFGCAQDSISVNDIEITTQLTFVEVQESSKQKFEKAISKLSLLAKEIKLKEDLDWLVYKFGTNKYLFINFSMDMGDVLKLKNYQDEFSKVGKATEFEIIIHELKFCEFVITRNFLQEMLLPWSSVKAISVTKHPLTTMIEFSIYPKYMNEFDQRTRQLAKLLKETNYSYPLEGNRGSLGAYSSVFHIWFYDDEMQGDINDHLEDWIAKKGKLQEFKTIMKSIETTIHLKKEYQLKYLPNLSY